MFICLSLWAIAGRNNRGSGMSMGPLTEPCHGKEIGSPEVSSCSPQDIFNEQTRWVV